MNTIKSIFVAVTLIAVGYGTHKVLHSPADDRLSAENIWDNSVGLEVPNVVNDSSAFDLPPLRKSDSSSVQNPFAVHPNPAKSDGTTGNPFATGPTTYPTPSPKPPVTQMESVPQTSISQYENPGRPDLGIGEVKSPDTSFPELTPPAPLQSENTMANSSPPALPDLSLSPPASSSDPHGLANLPNVPPVASVGIAPDAGPLNIPPPLPGSDNPGVAMTFQQPVSDNAEPSAVSAQAFANAWQTAQQSIGQGKLAEALATLSSVYNHPMNEAQRGQLLSMLDQLAGTVIYSQQHLLHPAYTPRGGETTAQVAMRQRVPADLLARVNGINPHQPLSSDMRLKLVTGPFRGELSRSKRELTLFLGKHYAGRFSVSFGNDFPTQATSFEVFEKSGARVYSDPRTGQQIAAGTPINPYGEHWIGLRSDGVATATCGMHSFGAGLDASDSRGCIGLASNDANDLKAILGLGSGITVVR